MVNYCFITVIVILLLGVNNVVCCGMDHPGICPWVDGWIHSIPPLYLERVCASHEPYFLDNGRLFFSERVSRGKAQNILHLTQWNAWSLTFFAVSSERN